MEPAAKKAKVRVSTNDGLDHVLELDPPSMIVLFPSFPSPFPSVSYLIVART